MKSIKKRGLGRGLDALLDASKSTNNQETSQLAASKEVAIEKLSPSEFQPRRHFAAEALNELAASIEQQGLMQPLVVRQKEGVFGEYEIIAGERRWRAAQQAGLTQVPVVIRQANDQEVLALALIENLQRQDLNPLEEAQALQRLIDDFSLSQQEVASLVGKARSSISNLLRLNNLHSQVQVYVANKQLDMGHARALLALPNPQQPSVAEQVIQQQLSVRQTEALVKKLLNPVNPASQAIKDPNITKLEENLAAKLGTQVKIHHGQQGKGRLEISYSSLNELDGILSSIKPT